MEKIIVATFVFFLIFQACQGVQWVAQPPDHAVLYACAHGTLSLPFTLLTSSGDVVESIQWFYSGRSEEIVAMEAHGLFLPTPTFSRRVSKSTNAGINVAHVQTLESGNYSVEVFARTASGDVVTLWRSVFVHVTDDLQTTDGDLHASLLPVAEYDNQTDDYHVVLTCGTFTYPTQPAFQASWMTPSENTLPSSGYRDNHFYLLVPNPVEGGAYSCQVPSVQACIHGNKSTNASVSVHNLEARMVVIEAKLGSKVSVLQSENSALQVKVSDLQVKNAALEAKDTALEAKVNLLEETQKRTVSFHARSENSETALPGYNSVVQFPTVLTNIGNGYDNSSGKFTAPYSATYCLLSHSGDGNNGYGVHMSLVVDDTELDTSNTYNRGNGLRTAFVQAVVHLTQGQKVWVKIEDIHYYFVDSNTAFSGFLVDYTP